MFNRCMSTFLAALQQEAGEMMHVAGRKSTQIVKSVLQHFDTEAPVSISESGDATVHRA